MSIGNEEQREFWDIFSEKWVTQKNEIDALMAPVLAELLTHADLQPGQHVLDVGCGTGTSVLAAAEHVGSDGFVLGVDISAPMIDHARRTAHAHDRVSFEVSDAADHGFQDAAFDAMISRFGVMFFADPTTAFINIRRGLKPGAQVTMACWSYLDKNPWFQVPMYAAKAQLGAPPPVHPDEPGPFAFRDRERVCGILSDAGFENAKGEEVSLFLTPPGDKTHAARHAASIGPASRTMAHFEGSESDFEAIVARVSDA
ncbi:MAG: class I SAM-dependent methyltransferase, partial [Pseudomonadota bacterium]